MTECPIPGHIENVLHNLNIINSVEIIVLSEFRWMVRSLNELKGMLRVNLIRSKFRRSRPIGVLVFAGVLAVAGGYLLGILSASAQDEITSRYFKSRATRASVLSSNEEIENERKRFALRVLREQESRLSEDLRQAEANEGHEPAVMRLMKNRQVLARVQIQQLERRLEVRR